MGINLVIVEVISGGKKKESQSALLFQKLWLLSGSASPCRWLCNIPAVSAEEEYLFPNKYAYSHVAVLNMGPPPEHLAQKHNLLTACSGGHLSP